MLCCNVDTLFVHKQMSTTSSKPLKAPSKWCLCRFLKNTFYNNFQNSVSCVFVWKGTTEVFRNTLCTLTLCTRNTNISSFTSFCICFYPDSLAARRNNELYSKGRGKVFFSMCICKMCILSFLLECVNREKKIK